MPRSTLIFLCLTFLGCGGKTLQEEPADGGTSDAPSSDTGLPVDWTSCSGPGQCVITARTCCGTCGEPTLGDMTAVRADRESSYRTSVCGTEPVACPGCASMKLDDSLQAWCLLGPSGSAPPGKCTAVDVRTEPVSACATDADCILRHSSCCEPCDERRDDLVALARGSIEAYRSKVCVGDEACSRCMSRYPADAIARCDAVKKHCVVTWVDRL